MKQDLINIGRSLKSGVMTKALQSFDRATMVVVITSWCGAVLLLAFALYTLSLSVTAKREMLTAAATEPGLPRIVSKAPESAELQPLVDRLQKRFPEINFTMSRDKSLTISAIDVSNFRLWLTVLSYIDTVTPQFRWTIREFCVGSKCEKNTPMRAVLAAEKIIFTTPEAGK